MSKEAHKKYITGMISIHETLLPKMEDELAALEISVPAFEAQLKDEKK